ncbi:MAG: hypothetical protein L6R38_008066 [Xanthoria sp. 2 TBL-2021]|nr:MAG: hypothetical protein L6R38_008066 [Xanthoria sp. 2 TBL-2021]
MADIVQGTLEVNFQRRFSVPVVEDRLGNILASTPGLGHAESSGGMDIDLYEIEGSERSESSSDVSDDPHSGTVTPDTIDSPMEDDNLQVRTKWQTRRMYPFLLHGLEPEPIYHEVVTTFKEFIGSKNGPDAFNYSRDDNGLAIEEAILRSLRFSGMDLREKEIADPYGSTLSMVDINPGSGFVRRLNYNEEPVFWIHGKPGSGKSTLMKCIAQEQRLRPMGERWGDNPPLPTITHFFSWSGTAMPNSQTGFLRSLLYQLLLQRTELLPTLFAEFWEAAAECSIGMLRALPETWHNWSVSQLRSLLHALLTNLDPEEKFPVVIDGLDECASTDLRDIILLVQHLSSRGNFKICIASRPDRAISQAFGSAPQIALEYSTEGDIERYAKHLLRSLPLLNKSNAADRLYLKRLINAIVLKAEGLFIWVRGIVESLRRGCTNGDSSLDLLRRLDELPHTLDDFYRDMLSRIDECHQVEAMIYLLIMAHARFPLSLDAFVSTVGIEDNFDGQSAKELMSGDTRRSWVLRVSERTRGLVVVESTGSG